MHNFARKLEGEMRQAHDVMREMDMAIGMVGLMFDHIGVDLERTDARQESDDLKALGGLLRKHQAPRSTNGLDLRETQDLLSDLGDRYGIEPISGGPYKLMQVMQIGEEILTSAVARIQSPTPGRRTA